MCRTEKEKKTILMENESVLSVETKRVSSEQWTMCKNNFGVKFDLCSTMCVCALNSIETWIAWNTVAVGWFYWLLCIVHRWYGMNRVSVLLSLALVTHMLWRTLIQFSSLHRSFVHTLFISALFCQELDEISKFPLDFPETEQQ